MSPIRYTISSDIMFLWSDPEFLHEGRFTLPWPRDARKPRFCNILEVNSQYHVPIYMVKVFIGDEVFVGWTPLGFECIEIYNKEQLLDGRFNKLFYLSC